MAEQKLLSEIAYELGATQGEFYTNEGGEKKLNSTDHRGRTYLAFDTLPKQIKEICLSKFKTISSADDSIKYIEPTHLILLYYRALAKPPRSGYIPWHQDNGDNDGEAFHPVLSFSIRFTPDNLGKEEIFKTVREERLGPDNQFYKVSKMK